MIWPGTFIGLAAGSWLAGIPGALLGLLLGQMLDRRAKLKDWAEFRSVIGFGQAVREDELLFLLLGRLAKSDGRVLEVHIEQARAEMRRLGLGTTAQQRAIRAFQRGKSARESLRKPLRRLAQQRNAGEALLRASWRMIWADGRAGPAETRLILAWGEWLDWGESEVRALAREYDPQRQHVARSGGDYQDALRLLGVGPTTEPELIKRAYRRLLSRHHPDKVAGSGGNPRRVREATELTGELHRAYSLIREQRGFR